jgi:hypothetical protein
MKRFLALGVLAATAARAQSIKPRPLGPVQATSTELLGLPTLARALPNGSVIVNDVLRRRLLLLDASLANYTVIADSTSGAVNGYGPRAGARVPYVGDSTLFLDPVAGSFLVIDPSGKVTRVMSPPRPSDNGAIASMVNGFPGFDAQGRMIYRSSYRMMPVQRRGGTLEVPAPPDSAPLLRVDLDTRRADTIGVLRLPKSVETPMTMPNGGTISMRTPVPLATIDDWAVLSDGTVALVRGQDYRIDFIRPDGSAAPSRKIAFDWKRLSDDDKVALADSIQKARAAGPQGGGMQQMIIGGGGGDMRFMVGGGGGGGMGMAVTERMVVGGAAATAVSASVASAASGSSSASSSSTSGAAQAGSAADSARKSGPGEFVMPAPAAPAIADMPDYMPAFTQTSARADADGNLWIRTTTPGAGAGDLVYDVINSQGVLADRIEVPKGMTIIGFGKGGVVYLSQREGYGARVLKAAVK